MKLENAIQNKRKFFCLYYGQRVLVTEQDDPGELSEVNTFFIDHVWDDDYLELRSIEDLNESEKAEGIDYLRSIGILIPWMGLSVQDLQDYGWTKTTTK